MKKILVAFSILTILLYSCKKEEIDSTQASRDHLVAEKIFNDIERVVEDGFIANGESKNCPAYTLKNSNSTDADTMIIDYGNGNPACISYGNIKRGRIIVIYTGKYRDSLSVMTTTFNDYYVNNNLVQGEQIITNQGRNSNGNMWFTIEVNDASINTSNNGTINWEASRIKEWIGGITTFFDISDDTYIVTGSASGNGVTGNSFTVTITEPLTIALACLPSCITKNGVAKMSPSGYSERIINYGDSICDCTIDVIINETTYPVVIN